MVKSHFLACRAKAAGASSNRYQVGHPYAGLGPSAINLVFPSSMSAEHTIAGT